MELQHFNAKIFVESDLTVDLERIIETFHDWIAEQSMAELLVDVADYRHVPAGPGVLLVGHQADYALDNARDRWGLLYNRKAALDGSNIDRMTQAFRSAATACLRLEEKFSSDGLQFSRTEFDLIVNDRGFAPNSAETFAACRPEIESFLRDTLAVADFTLDHDPDPRRRFAVAVKCAAPIEWTAAV